MQLHSNHNHCNYNNHHHCSSNPSRSNNNHNSYNHNANHCSSNPSRSNNNHNSYNNHHHCSSIYNHFSSNPSSSNHCSSNHNSSKCSLSYFAGPLYPLEGTKSSRSDDGSSPRISLLRTFNYFGQSYSQIYVNQNGHLTFDYPWSSFSPQRFPMYGTRDVIAPFWTDLDNRENGEIYYVQYTNGSLLQQVTQDINAYFPALNFQASWVFIATWHEVAYFPTTGTQTTFQAVLTTDGHYSFVLMNYGSIASTSRSVQAGYDTINSPHHFTIPGSFSSIATGPNSAFSLNSNVNVPGRWAFRVDHGSRGCTFNGQPVQLGDSFWSDSTCAQKCTCTSAGLQCSSNPCSFSQICRPAAFQYSCQTVQRRTCTVSGDPHYYTFDNSVFHFQGTCTYVLSEQCQNGLPYYRVEGKNGHQGSTRVSWTQLVKVFVHDETIELVKRDQSQAKVNGSFVTVPFSLRNGSIQVYQSGFSVIVSTDFGLMVSYDKYLYVRISLPYTYQNSTCGFCGNFNNHPEDDFRTRQGEVVSSDVVFANSWKASGDDEPGCDPQCEGLACAGCTESEATLYRNSAHCGILENSTGPFAACHQQLPPGFFVDSCVYDLCVGRGYQPILCQALNVYSSQCQQNRIQPQSWRRPGFCEIPCPANSHFEAQGTGCPSTCVNPNSTYNFEAEGRQVAIEMASSSTVKVDDQLIRLPFSTGSNRIRIFQSSTHSVILRTDFGVTLQTVWPHFVRVTAPGVYSGLLGGLCGNYNVDQHDDFRTPSGNLVSDSQVFGDSWRDGSLADHCVENRPRSSATNFSSTEYCGVLTSPTGPFTSCWAAVNPWQQVDACVGILQRSDNPASTLCEVLRDYALMCQYNGVSLGQWRNATGCELTCPSNSHYELCGSSCPSSCPSLSFPFTCNTQCQEGCQCNDGFVLSGNQCVPPTSCGCFHDGRYRQAGEQFWDGEECQSFCTCNGVTGVVQCSPSKCGPQESCSVVDGEFGCHPNPHGTCSASGDPHYLTFDGKAYDFQGTCRYVLATVCNDTVDLHQFSVKAKNEPWFGLPVSITAEVYVDILGYEVRMSRGNRGTVEGSCSYIITESLDSNSNNETQYKVVATNKHRGNNLVSFVSSVDIYLSNHPESVHVRLGSNKRVKVNGAEVSLPTTTGTFGQVMRQGSYIVFDAVDVVVQFDGSSTLLVRMGHNYQNRVRGMCGNFNGDPTDDKVLPNGTLAENDNQFGHSWRSETSQAGCRSTDERSGDGLSDCRFIEEYTELCRVITNTSGPFSSCHLHSDPQPFFISCVYDLCLYTPANGMLCSAVSAYEKTCTNLGLSIPDWRSALHCAEMDPCEQLDCAEYEWCGKKDGAYGCFCDDRHHRPNNESYDSNIECSSSSGTMSVSRCQLFEAGFHSSALHLRDSSCKGTLQDGRLIFHFDNDNHLCGTALRSNGTHFMYENTIQGNVDPHGGLISRQRNLHLDFFCVYPLAQALSMAVGINPVESILRKKLPVGTGSYRMRMIPYEDEAFRFPFSTNRNIELEVDEMFYMEVRTEGVDQRQFATVLDSCWATPVNQANYPVRWDLIASQCPNPEDGTVEVIQNGVSTVSRFSFRMFTFTNHTQIFLHCSVHLCLLRNNNCRAV
ncbi:alpha-tectorin-like, partial [Poecilia formosa]|uniref:alpha-tectorin-like n=1 Tax=Poecilia formosa TaxID=48698 RepID=UPI0007BA5DF9